MKQYNIDYIMGLLTLITTYNRTRRNYDIVLKHNQDDIFTYLKEAINISKYTCIARPMRTETVEYNERPVYQLHDNSLIDFLHNNNAELSLLHKYYNYNDIDAFSMGFIDGGIYPAKRNDGIIRFRIQSILDDDLIYKVINHITIKSGAYSTVNIHKTGAIRCNWQSYNAIAMYNYVYDDTRQFPIHKSIVDRLGSIVTEFINSRSRSIHNKCDICGNKYVNTRFLKTLTSKDSNKCINCVNKGNIKFKETHISSLHNKIQILTQN